MAAQKFTRQEFYDLVWSKPMTKVAADFGMSDVGLKKHCTNADIPVPERGYWAKKVSGKKVRQLPLPPRKPGEPDAVVIQVRPSRTAGTKASADLANADAPPAVPDDIASLIARERTAIGQLMVGKTLANPHPVVARWIEEERRQKEDRRRSPLLSNLPDTRNHALENRKLRILSALFKGLDNRGYTTVADRDRAGVAHVRVGQQDVHFELVEIVSQVRRLLTPEEKKGHWNLKAKWHQEQVNTGRLKFSFKDSLRDWHPSRWADDGETLIEDKLSEIAIGFAVAGEALLQAANRREEQWRRQQQEDMERYQRRREREEEEKRVQGLMQRAQEWRAALDIRAYVEAVCQAPGLDREAVTIWAEWALARAAEIDPIDGGRGLDLTNHEPPVQHHAQFSGYQHFGARSFWRR